MPIETPLIKTADDSITNAATRRVLVISYHFPPVGGAGVQRPVKFVKYLRKFGWDASVLMAANPSVPVFDESLCRDIPDDTVIRRAKTWEPGYGLKKNMSQAPGEAQRQSISKAALRQGVRFMRKAAGVLLQPDAQVLWLPSAWSTACRLQREMPHDAIFATAPPYSNLLLGSLLKRRFGIPLILDYRDEWDLSSVYLENSQKDAFSRFAQEKLQRQILRSADAIVATTKASAQRLQDRAAGCGSRADATCIYNGFDDDDLKFLRSESTDDENLSNRFRLVYTGTLWNLTDVSPLVNSIELLHREKPRLLERLQLNFVGRKTPEQAAVLERLDKTACEVVSTGYCDHHDAMKVMASANALCLLLSDVPGAERVAPAKLFEYLATGKEILAITPDGETAEIVRRFYPQGQFGAQEVSAIADWLEKQIAHVGENSLVDLPDVSEFSRENEAKQLADLLNQHVGSQHIPVT